MGQERKTGGPDHDLERRKLVDTLVAEGVLKTPAVRDAMRKVPRELFVPRQLQEYAYIDAPLPTAQGQTISAPHIP